MATLHTYLNFNGNTEEAFNFYKSVFGGDFSNIQRFNGMPGCDGVPTNDKEKIMHISLPIGNSSILMGTDTVEGMKPVDFGNNISISAAVDSENEADKLFAGLSEGGIVNMPLEKTFWNAYFGMLTDKFGIQWLINYDYAN